MSTSDACDDRPLELSPEQMRRMILTATERIVAHIESLPRQPASGAENAAVVDRVRTDRLPHVGQPFAELVRQLFDDIVPHSFNTAGPGFMAYVPGGGLFHAAVADLMADAFNRYVTVWAAAPGLVQLESDVIRWFCEIVGFPASGGGYLATGGSLANFGAVVTARRERLPENFLDGTIYASDQIHHSVLKAAMLAGFPSRNVRLVPSDGSYRIRIDELEARVRCDREAGLTPFMIVGSAGTTNTGAIDPLGALAEVGRRERLWLHLDAAYGGFFMLTERGRQRMIGIERADSITLDPHKGLFLPYGTGCLLVRDRETLKRAHNVVGDYMPSLQDDPERLDFCSISPELSRDFRGLRAWLPLKMHGAGPFEAALDEKLDLAQWATDALGRIDGIEIVAAPELSLVAFQLVRPGVGAEQQDESNRDLLSRVNARNNVYLTGTTLGRGFVLRICVLNFRTHQDRVQLALVDIAGSVREILEEQVGG